MLQDSNKSEIRKGLLVAAVLAVISDKKMYATEILAVLSSTQFATQEGTLYPLLGKLKREGLLLPEWVESPSGPPRKYYSLSPSGIEYGKELLKYLNNVERELTDLRGAE